MEKEIIETYAFNPEDYYDGRRKSDGKTFRKSKLYPRLDVEVSSSELEKLPSSAIQTFRFKFRPAETPPTLMDTEDDLDDFDMK